MNEGKTVFLDAPLGHQDGDALAVMLEGAGHDVLRSELLTLDAIGAGGRSRPAATLAKMDLTTVGADLRKWMAADVVIAFAPSPSLALGFALGMPDKLAIVVARALADDGLAGLHPTVLLADAIIGELPAVMKLLDLHRLPVAVPYYQVGVQPVGARLVDALVAAGAEAPALDPRVGIVRDRDTQALHVPTIVIRRDATLDNGFVPIDTKAN